MENTLYLHDFGAVGDGVTDDAKAIHKALQALQSLENGGTLVFEPDATYYYLDNGAGQKPVVFFRGQKNLTLQGQNSTILLGGYDHYYMDVEECTNITVEGINFDYGEYKPGFYASFESLDIENGRAVMIADRDIHLANGQEYNRSHCRELFACINIQTARWHMYISSYKMLDQDARRFEVEFLKTDARTMNRLKLDFLPKQGLVMMMPFSGNCIERAFSVHHNTDFTMRNVNVYSASRHVFSLQYNDGEFLFDNVQIRRSEKDRDLRFVSWGDVYHLLQNRAHYVWKNCFAEWNYDDVFNISVSLLVPREVFARDEANLFFKETGGAFAKLLPGDRVTLVHSKTGAYLRTEIAEVIRQEGAVNHVRFADGADWLEAADDIWIYVDSLAAPGTVMENCHFDGTFRARTEISFLNTYFYVRRFWVGNETVWEGPISKDVIFRNCTFEYDDYNEPYWHFTSHSHGPGTAHLENIVFENCVGADKRLMEFSPEDEIIIRQEENQ